MSIDNIGQELARDLETESLSYHVKSDDRDILGYEAAIILGMISPKTETSEPSSDNWGSVLLGSWGKHTRPKVPALVERVRAFYTQYEKIRNEPSGRVAPREHRCVGLGQNGSL